MKLSLGLPIRRLVAFALDWLCLAVWGGLLFGLTMLLTQGEPPPTKTPWHGQAVSLLLMTLPFILYFAFTETSCAQATLGKRIVGLKVRSRSGGKLSFSSSFLRNAIKFTPWEFGHLVANQAASAGEAGLAAWVWLPAAIAVLGPLWWIGALFLRPETPYNQWAGAVVERSQPPAVSGR